MRCLDRRLSLIVDVLMAHESRPSTMMSVGTPKVDDVDGRRSSGTVRVRLLYRRRLSSPASDCSFAAAAAAAAAAGREISDRTGCPRLKEGETRTGGGEGALSSHPRLRTSLSLPLSLSLVTLFSVRRPSPTDRRERASPPGSGRRRAKWRFGTRRTLAFPLARVPSFVVRSPSVRE